MASEEKEDLGLAAAGGDDAGTEAVEGLDEDELAEQAEAGDTFTVPGLDLKELMPVEQTVVVLKPDAESYEKEIKQMVEGAGFAVVKSSRTRLRRERSEL